MNILRLEKIKPNQKYLAVGCLNYIYIKNNKPFVCKVIKKRINQVYSNQKETFNNVNTRNEN